MGGLTPQPEQMKFGALKKGRFFFDFSGVICELGRCWDFKVDLVGSLVDHEGRENTGTGESQTAESRTGESQAEHQ